MSEAIFTTDGVRIKLRIEPVFKYLNGIEEATFFNDNKQVNRVEVFLAIKTPGQIGCMIRGGMKAITQRAAEPKYLEVILGVQKFRDVVDYLHKL